MRNRSLDHGMVSYVRVYLASYSGKLVVDSELILLMDKFMQHLHVP